MLVTAWVLLAGFLLKAPCMHVPWDGTQFDRFCYTDLPVIYHGRGLAGGEMPYVEAWNEYPVVTGLWQYATAWASDGPWGFFVWNAVGLGVIALVVSALLYAMVGDPRRVFLWAAAPALAAYAFHNWEILSVGAAVAGLYAYRRGHLAASGIAFAVGASAKVWPGLFLVFLGLALLRKHRTLLGPTGRFLLGATATMLLLHVPFLLWNGSLYIEGYAWHLQRGPTFESWWGIADVWTDRWGLGVVATLFDPETLPILTKALFFAGFILLVVAVLRGWLGGLEATFGSVVLFMTTNQVFSVQYALWLLPFFVLLDRFPVWAALLFFVADAVVQATIWPFFSALSASRPDWFAYYERLSWASTIRFFVLVWILGIVTRWAVVRGRTRETPAVAVA